MEANHHNNCSPLNIKNLKRSRTNTQNLSEPTQVCKRANLSITSFTTYEENNDTDSSSSGSTNKTTFQEHLNRINGKNCILKHKRKYIQNDKISLQNECNDDIPSSEQGNTSDIPTGIRYMDFEEDSSSIVAYYGADDQQSEVNMTLNNNNTWMVTTDGNDSLTSVNSFTRELPLDQDTDHTIPQNSHQVEEHHNHQVGHSSTCPNYSPRDEELTCEHGHSYYPREDICKHGYSQKVGQLASQSEYTEETETEGIIAKSEPQANSGAGTKLREEAATTDAKTETMGQVLPSYSGSSIPFSYVYNPKQNVSESESKASVVSNTENLARDVNKSNNSRYDYETYMPVVSVDTDYDDTDDFYHTAPPLGGTTNNGCQLQSRILNCVPKGPGNNCGILKKVKFHSSCVSSNNSRMDFHDEHNEYNDSCRSVPMDTDDESEIKHSIFDIPDYIANCPDYDELSTTFHHHKERQYDAQDYIMKDESNAINNAGIYDAVSCNKDHSVNTLGSKPAEDYCGESNPTHQEYVANNQYNDINTYNNQAEEQLQTAFENVDDIYNHVNMGENMDTITNNEDLDMESTFKNEFQTEDICMADKSNSKDNILETFETIVHQDISHFKLKENCLDVSIDKHDDIPCMNNEILPDENGQKYTKNEMDFNFKEQNVVINNDKTIQAKQYSNFENMSNKLNSPYLDLQSNTNLENPINIDVEIFKTTGIVVDKDTSNSYVKDNLTETPCEIAAMLRAQSLRNMDELDESSEVMRHRFIKTLSNGKNLDNKKSYNTFEQLNNHFLNSFKCSMKKYDGIYYENDETKINPRHTCGSNKHTKHATTKIPTKDEYNEKTLYSSDSIKQSALNNEYLYKLQVENNMKRNIPTCNHTNNRISKKVKENNYLKENSRKGCIQNNVINEVKEISPSDQTNSKNKEQIKKDICKKRSVSRTRSKKKSVHRKKEKIKHEIFAFMPKSEVEKRKKVIKKNKIKCQKKNKNS